MTRVQPTARLRAWLVTSTLLAAACLLAVEVPAAAGQPAPDGQPTAPGGRWTLEDVASGTASATEELVLTTETSEAAASVTIPSAALADGSTVTVASLPGAAEQLLAAGIHPPAGMALLAAFTIDGQTSNGLPLPTPFADRVSVGFEIPAAAVPSTVEPGNFELAAWDGAEWSLLIPATSIRNDGSVSVRDRVLEFAEIYAAMYVPARLAGAPQPGGISLLVATVRSRPADVIAALTSAGCDASSVAVVRGGRWRTYIPGAPDAVNDGFPSAVSAQEPVVVRCR